MTAFAELLPELRQGDHAREDRKDGLMALTADERVAAMRAGELSYGELAYWSSAHPCEVPLVGTGDGGPGEFEWIAMFEPDVAEHDQHCTGRRDRHHARVGATPVPSGQ